MMIHPIPGYKKGKVKLVAIGRVFVFVVNYLFSNVLPVAALVAAPETGLSRAIQPFTPKLTKPYRQNWLGSLMVITLLSFPLSSSYPRPKASVWAYSGTTAKCVLLITLRSILD